MELYEKTFSIPMEARYLSCGETLLSYLKQRLETLLTPNEIPLRFVVSSSSPTIFVCEVGILSTTDSLIRAKIPSIFQYHRQGSNREDEFNIALIIPTGIGASIGGHAGDAGPLSRLFGTICDWLITHPNVVNASDINELPENGLYVEGSALSRFLLGTIGLQPIRSNRILYLLEEQEDPKDTHPYINAVNAAQASFGIKCSQVTVFTSEMRLSSHFSSSGRAVGTVKNMKEFISFLYSLKREFDAVAISTYIKTDKIVQVSYEKEPDSMANPWGGIEALLTHTISLLLDLPSAHSPIFPANKIVTDIVDARLAAEEISTTFLQCIFKGLHRAPRIVSHHDFEKDFGTLCSRDISCLIIPRGCLGLPTLAALIQGIPVIEVIGNTNVMSNDLKILPWQSGQLYQVGDYIEAAGLACVLKSGISLESVKRPLKTASVNKIKL